MSKDIKQPTIEEIKNLWYSRNPSKDGGDERYWETVRMLFMDFASLQTEAKDARILELESSLSLSQKEKKLMNKRGQTQLLKGNVLWNRIT